MVEIKAPAPVDMAEFRPGLNNPRVMYGLPADVQFCRSCIYSNQKPTSAREYTHTAESKKSVVNFDDQGICQACRTIERKKAIDWDERNRMLVDLCDRFRSKDGSFDCLVPGSGGKDSIYAAHVLKHRYGMHPLTVTFAPHMYTDWGWKNFNAWLGSGFDNYLFHGNRRVQRLLTRLAVEKLFHPFQPFMMGQMYYPPKMALKLGIKLIFYGEDANEYGNDVKDVKPTKDLDYFTTAARDGMYIAGTAVPELRDVYGLTNADLDAYMPPPTADLIGSNSEVHYLGFYLRWHPQACYYYAAEHAGFQASPERTVGTYSKYSSIDDKIDDLHYYTTYIKFGIGRATYDAAQEVRHGDITREEAVALARRYDGEFPERFFDEIMNYLSLPESEFQQASRLFEQPVIDRDYFLRLTDRFRSPHLWEFVDGAWKLRATSADGL
jgi:N-acetyl sugar amidotransferase